MVGVAHQRTRVSEKAKIFYMQDILLTIIVFEPIIFVTRGGTLAVWSFYLHFVANCTWSDPCND